MCPESAYVKNLFIDVAKVVCPGQKSYVPITLNQSAAGAGGLGIIRSKRSRTLVETLN